MSIAMMRSPLVVDTQRAAKSQRSGVRGVHGNSTARATIFRQLAVMVIIGVYPSRTWP
jgi:hypothetical protein